MAIGIILVVTTASSLFVFYYLEQQDDFAYYINMAGKQRMLSQKISLHASYYLHANNEQVRQQNENLLRLALDELKSNHTHLKQEVSLSLFNGVHFSQITQLYQNDNNGINSLLHDFYLDVDRLLETNAHSGYQLLFQLEQMESLLQSLNQVVNLYEKQAAESISQLKLIKILIILLVIFILLAELKYIFQPLNKLVVTSIKAIEKHKAEVERAKQKIELANDLKTHLLSNISHEVRTPLNGVIGMLKIIEENPYQLQTNIIKAQHSARDLLKILDSLMKFSELERDLVVLKKQPFNLFKLVDEVSEPYLASCQLRDINFEISVTENTPIWLQSDAKAIAQVLDNILSNAVKFTERGRVSLDISFLSKNKFQTLIIEVHDTGVGIAQSVLDSIINEKYYPEKDVNRKFSGCGVGLSIVNKLVNLLDGQIRMSSQLGKGTDTSIIIPVMPCLADSRLSEYQTNLIKQLKIILVTQNPLQAYYYQSLLNQLNCQVELVEDTSLEQFTAARADIVLFDFDLIPYVPSLDDKIRWIALGQTSDPSRFDKLDYIAKFSDSKALLAAIFRSQASLDSDQFLTWVNRKILVAEDNHINQEVIKNLLESFKLNVDLVFDGQQAIDAVQAKKYDLIFMDLQMPVLDGLSATKAIKRIDERKNTPIVALTAHAFRADEEICYQAGMDDYLTKPIEVEELKLVLSRFLG